MKRKLTSLILAATMAMSGTAFAFEQSPIHQLKPKDQVLITGPDGTPRQFHGNANNAGKP